MTVVKADDGTLYNIPADQIVSNIQSGQWWQFEQPTTITVVSPGGRRIGVEFSSSDAVREALSKGYRFESAQEERSAWLEQEYGGAGQQALTVLQNAADSATFGAAKAVFGGQEWRNRDETNTGSRVFGQILGVAGPGGAANLVAKGAKAGMVTRAMAKLPAAKITQWGNKLEKTLTAGRGPVGKVVGKGAAWGAEGMVWGAHAGISDALDQDMPLFSQEFAGHVGLHAILGGGIGGGLGIGLPVVGGALRRGLRKIKPKARPIVEAPAGNPMEIEGPDLILPNKLRDEIEALTGPLGEGFQTAEGRANLVTRVSAALSGKNADELSILLSGPQAKPIREALENFSALRGESTQAVTKSQNEVLKAGDIAQEMWGNESKALKMMDLLPENIDTPEMRVATRGIFVQAVDSIEATYKTLEEGLSKKFINRIRSKAKLTRKDIDSYDSARNMYFALDRFKRELGIEMGRLEKAVKGPAEVRYFEELLGIYNKTLKEPLEHGMFGQAAKVQAEVNEAFFNALRIRGHANVQTKVVEDFYGKIYEADPGSIERLIVKPGRSRDADIPVRQWMERNAHLERAARAMAPLDDGMLAQANKMAKANKTIADHLNRMQKLNFSKQLHETLLTGGGMSTEFNAVFVGWILGRGLGGYVGGVVGGAAGALLSPKAMYGLKGLGDKIAGAMPKLGAAAEIIQGSRAGMRGKIGAGVRSIFNAKVPIGVQVYHATREKKKRPVYRPKNKQEAYRKIRDDLESLQDPTTLMNRVAASMGDLGEQVPDLATGVTIVAARATRYLLDTAPKAQVRGTFAALQGKEGVVSDHELTRWFRRVRVVEDPSSVFESMRNGRLSDEEIQTLQAVYPDLYGKMCQLLMAYASQGKPDGKTLRQIGKFIGVPLTNVDEPAFIQAAQLRLRAVQSGAQPRQSQKKLDPSKLKMDENELGGTDLWMKHKANP